MPRLAEFYGIVISMYYLDHNPPHFHVAYAEYHAQVTIEGLDILDGRMPPRALALVREWGQEHAVELRLNWDRARERRPLLRIEPLA